MRFVIKTIIIYRNDYATGQKVQVLHMLTLTVMIVHHMFHNAHSEVHNLLKDPRGTLALSGK